jgi:hypothetical protein
MAYQYHFDSTSPGDFRCSRGHYKVVQEGLRLLCKELEIWDQRTIEDGAAYTPFEQEVADLTQLIGFGDQQLSQANTQEIVVRGISVGNFRYVKAALMFVIQYREQDCAKKAEVGWPEPAVRSLAAGIEKVRSLAGAIDYEPSDILWEIMPKEPVIPRGERAGTMEWDVFISHASEDKEAFVRPLAEGLAARGVRVWFDEFTLTIGDSLRQSIDRGLARSRFGVVVVSPNFLRKGWPQRELDGLVAREIGGMKVILPVWHEIGIDGVRTYSPTLADRLAASSDKGLNQVIAELVRAIGREDQLQLGSGQEASVETEGGEELGAVQVQNSKTPKVAVADDVVDRLKTGSAT